MGARCRRGQRERYMAPGAVPTPPRRNAETSAPLPARRSPIGGALRCHAVPVSRRRSAVLALAALSAALLVGCGSGGEDVDTASGSAGATSSSPSPSSTAAGTAEPDDEAADAPPFQANTDPDTEEASSG